ncbi:ligase-associated DNA damage response endonuclease PdeM [Flavobacterium album]
MYWIQKKMLLISDAHLGKVSHFRKHGAAIPGGIIHKNFIKLDEAIHHFNPESICFLGDLFHSELNNEWQLFQNWVVRTNIPIVLVAGNHDIINPAKYHDINIQIVSDWELDGVLLTHYPEIREGFFTLCGHIHPAVELRGAGRQYLKLPCFFKSHGQMILPAFGEFTGTYVMQPLQDDVVYAIIKDAVIKVAFD